uniref:RING-type domain-containing protein n=1 Tax=Pelagomonas calceolata TaxID=35677 RepID=A0A7S3ZU52_9STRA|mmetsp:Transcript_23808/g.71257  ORF Transcript_23808/g.71257 Transcript_23808/m.71257 type:complete len:258 (+) Transcript_23808:211-984(+)
MDCSICLDALDSGVVALPCGHRFHAACLAQCAAAVGTAATTSRRGTLTACPNCRTTSRVAPYKPAAYDVGDRVSALWGYKWYPGVVDEVLEGGYKVAWDDGDEGEVPAAHVRAEQLTVDVDVPAARDASPPAVVTPRAALPVEPLSPARPPPSPLPTYPAWIFESPLEQREPGSHVDLSPAVRRAAVAEYRELLVGRSRPAPGASTALAARYGITPRSIQRWNETLRKAEAKGEDPVKALESQRFGRSPTNKVGAHS